MRRRPLLGLAIAIGVAVAVASVLLRPDGLRGYPAPGLAWLSAPQVAARGETLAASLLGVVYDAFEETEEAAVYDRLAEVSAGPALEALYLERMGTMVGGGLDGSDQAIHEMEVVRLDAARDGSTVRMDATWQVIGTVGHSEHVHVRGNTYSAILTVEPVGGAWRITGFDLTDVDRSARIAAGECELPPAPSVPGSSVHHAIAEPGGGRRAGPLACWLRDPGRRLISRRCRRPPASGPASTPHGRGSASVPSYRSARSAQPLGRFGACASRAPSRSGRPELD